MKRTLRFQGTQYHVLRHSSSGLGEQFTLEWIDNGKTKFLYLNADSVEKDLTQKPIFDACCSLFENTPTLGNNIRLEGSFYQPKN